MSVCAKPKLIFFDIDDTIYNKKTARICDGLTDAFIRLKQNNIIIALATGRAACIFPEPVQNLIQEVGIDAFVTINGQLVTYQNRDIAEYSLSHAQINDSIDFLQAHHLPYALMTKDRLYTVGDSVYLRYSLDFLKIPYTPIALSDFDYTQKVYQLLTFCPDNRAIQFDLPDTLKTIRWHKHGVDILDKNGTKLRGILALLAHLQIDLADCAAFGDGYNDLEMIAKVGMGVAMGNACDELKNVARYIAPSVDEEGVVGFLKQQEWIDG